MQDQPCSISGVEVQELFTRPKEDILSTIKLIFAIQALDQILLSAWFVYQSNQICIHR